MLRVLVVLGLNATLKLIRPSSSSYVLQHSELVEYVLLTDAFLSSLGLQLVGPYDVLAGKTKRRKQHVASRSGGRPNYLLHWRYYYDPPEFLTVVRGDDTKQFHIGYYRCVLALIQHSSSSSSSTTVRSMPVGV